MVYVDSLQGYGWKMYGRTVASCHMVADSIAELHAMAARLGLKTCYLQRSGMGDLHYDLTPSRRARAVLLGAVELDRRAFVSVIRRLRGAPALHAPKTQEKP